MEIGKVKKESPKKPEWVGHPLNNSDIGYYDEWEEKTTKDNTDEKTTK